MSHTTPNAPIPDTPLVWTTVSQGTARQIVDEWSRLCRRPSTLRHVNTWDFLPHPITHLDQLLTLSGFGSELDDTAGDTFLWHLVRQAHTDDIAARVVLHRIFPSLVAIARRRGRIFSGGINAALIEVFAHAWIVIREFPSERRTSKIASNLVRDTEYFAFVRHTRLRRVEEAQVGSEVLSSIVDTIDTGASDMELDDVLAYAAELGVHQDDIELLTLLGSGVRGVEIANARGVAPRTIRNHRRYAIDAVIDALTDAHQ